MKKIIILILVFWGIEFSTIAQSIVSVRHDWNNNDSDFSKRVLTGYSLSLLLDSAAVDLIMLGDSSIAVPKLTELQRAYLMDKKYALVRFENDKGCFVSHFPNVFVDSSTTALAMALGFYNETQMRKGEDSSDVKTTFNKHLRMWFATDGGRIYTPILIGCKEFQKRGYIDYK